jgi:ribosomal protein L44E
MKKTIVFLLLIVIMGLALVSCEKETVTYCPFCGQSNLKAIEKFNKDTARTEIYYECTNSNCKKVFAAGKNPY